MKIPSPVPKIRDRYSARHQKLMVHFEGETVVFNDESFVKKPLWMGEPTTEYEQSNELTLPADAALELTAALLVEHNLQKSEPKKMILFPDKLDYSQIPGLSCRAAFEKLRPANTLDALSHPELIRDEVYLVSDWIQKHYPKNSPGRRKNSPSISPGTIGKVSIRSSTYGFPGAQTA